MGLELIRDLRLKRLQRGAEYALLALMHLLFLLAFRAYYKWWMALVLFAATFMMNFRLTLLREQRRTAAVNSAARIRADAFESIMFLLFVVLLSMGSLAQRWLGVTNEEYLAYVSSLLGGLFLSGLVGELYWQARNFGQLDEVHRGNYVANLRRTIILPYTITRRRHS